MPLPALGLLASAPSFLSSLTGGGGPGAATSVPQSSSASVGQTDQGGNQFTQGSAFVVGGLGSSAGGGVLPPTMTLPVQAPGLGLWLGLGAAIVAGLVLLRSWRG